MIHQQASTYKTESPVLDQTLNYVTTYQVDL